MQKKHSDFKKAIQLCEKEYSHEDLISFLQSGSVIERQYAALTIKSVHNKFEAGMLLSNLVGVDGKIREAAALKIADLTAKNPELFCDESFFNTFSEATIDIDGNVCRLAIESAKNLSNNSDFSFFYTEKMITVINSALIEISKFTFRDKKYKINKQIFKIYWCLEALYYFYEYVKKNEIIKVLTACSELQEYTIREKCAKILLKMGKSEENMQIYDKLSNDENYYVRNIFE